MFILRHFIVIINTKVYIVNFLKGGVFMDLKERRKELNLTLEDVGNYVGVGKSTVRKWENGDIANMKRDKIASLAKIAL